MKNDMMDDMMIRVIKMSVRAKANAEMDRLLGVVRQATIIRKKALEEEIKTLRKELTMARSALEGQRVLKKEMNTLRDELTKVRLELEGERESAREQGRGNETDGRFGHFDGFRHSVWRF